MKSVQITHQCEYFEFYPIKYYFIRVKNYKKAVFLQLNFKKIKSNIIREENLNLAAQNLDKLSLKGLKFINKDSVANLTFYSLKRYLCTSTTIEK